MKHWNISLSFRYNGFGFMCLWIYGFYFQFGTIKLMITHKINLSMLPKKGDR